MFGGGALWLGSLEVVTGVFLVFAYGLDGRRAEATMEEVVEVGGLTSSPLFFFIEYGFFEYGLIGGMELVSSICEEKRDE